MQCSGIHRSLGVHISKVRSATLDTWLPDQVAFVKGMGNDKSNRYWEAELPANYVRAGIENFIHAKYVGKRWIPKDGAREERNLSSNQGSGAYTRHCIPESKSLQLVTGGRMTVLQHSEPQVLPKLFKQVVPDGKQEIFYLDSIETRAKEGKPSVSPMQAPKISLVVETQKTCQKPEPKPGGQEGGVVPAESAFKAGPFNISSLKENKRNSSKTSAVVNHSSGEPQETTDENVDQKFGEKEIKLDSGIQELLKGFQWNNTAVAEEPLKDSCNIINLSDKMMTTSIQQQIMPAQQQQQPSSNRLQPHAGNNLYQNNSNAVHITIQNWGMRANHQSPGKTTAMQMRNVQSLNFTTNLNSRHTSYHPGRGGRGGGGGGGANTAPSVVPIPLSGRDFDFSSLVEGMLRKN